MPKTIKLSFDGELTDCLVTTQDNGEIVCYAKDRRFVKFPKGTDLAKAAKKHNDAHKKKPVFAEEVEARQAEMVEWFYVLPDVTVKDALKAAVEQGVLSPKKSGGK